MMVVGGKSMDMIKLFLNVKKKGGYNRVTEDGLWDFVAKECGFFDASDGMSLKLFYVENLEKMFESLKRERCSMDLSLDSEPFLSEFSDIKKKKDVDLDECDLDDVCADKLLEFLNEECDGSMDTSSDLDPFLSEVSDTKKKNDLNHVKVDDLEALLVFLNKECDASSSGGCLMYTTSSDLGPFLSEVSDIKKEHDDANCVKVPEIDHRDTKRVLLPNNVKEECLKKNVSDSVRCLKRKRKRGEDSSAIGILDWILKVARDPCDPGIGSLPECSEWKDYAATDVIWKQALMIHEAMLSKRNDYSKKRQKMMHPTMYDEPEKFRHSQRILHSAKKDHPKKPCSRTVSKSSSSPKRDNNNNNDENPHDHPRKPHSRTVSRPSSSPKRDNHNDENPHDHPRKPRSRTVSRPSYPKRDNNNDEKPDFPDYLSNKHRQTRVNIGQKYQADVPEWTEKKKKSKSSYEVDTEWFGTPVWPLEQHNKKNLIEREPFGKGRSDSCGCQFPGSTECVRFHVSEKSKRLKLELGIAFYLWRFNSMGEGTSVTWTKDEENEFLETWKLSPKPLPSKSRALLVNYYFNVYLLRRRGEQNRISPNNITSDDEHDEDTVSEPVEPETVGSTKKTVKTGIK